MTWNNLPTSSTQSIEYLKLVTAKRSRAFFMTGLLDRPQRTKQRTDDEFVVFEAVPVFKEHTNRDGVEIDKDALERICERCNDRIRETGDYAPVVLRHTTDDGERDPEVVGFAGPYFMGTVGQTKPKSAILANLHIFKEDSAKARKYPRLSVEYWASEDDPTSGYFDPISLLGAETPELDLGIRYGKGKRGRRPMRYSKVERFQAFPGGSNTYIPGTEDEKKKYSKEISGMDDASLQQLVQVLQPIIQAAVQEAVAGMKEPPINELDASPPDSGAVPPPDAALTPEPPPADVPPPELGDEAVPPEENVDHYAKMCGFATEDEADKYFAGLDENGQTQVRSGIDTDDNTDRKTKMQKYAVKPTVEKYQKENGELRTRYNKLHREHEELKTRYAKDTAELTEARKEKKKAERYQRLTQRRDEGIVFDLDAELSETEAYTDEQFDTHVDKIMPTRYQRVLTNFVPTERPLKYDGSGKDEKRERYAKQAAATVAAKRAKGERADFKEEYDALVAADGSAAA